MVTTMDARSRGRVMVVFMKMSVSMNDRECVLDRGRTMVVVVSMVMCIIIHIVHLIVCALVNVRVNGCPC